MAVYEKPIDRVLELRSSGNLAVSQALREYLGRDGAAGSLWNAANLFEVAQRVGDAIRVVAAREAEALTHAGVEFNINFCLAAKSWARHHGISLFTLRAISLKPQMKTAIFKLGKPNTENLLSTAL